MDGAPESLQSRHAEEARQTAVEDGQAGTSLPQEAGERRAGRLAPSWLGPAWLEAPWATFVGIRLAFLLFTAFTLLWAPRADPTRTSFAWGGLSDTVFGAFAQWDARNFLRIAEEGYTNSSAASMPAYPGLIHLLGPLIGSDLVAGVLIAFVAGAIGVQLVHVLAREILGPTVARDTTLLLALYPLSFVFTAAFSEGLFLAAAAGAAVCGLRGRYWLAGLLAGIAVSTRLIGLALVPMLLVLAWPAARERGLRLLVPLVVLPAAGLGAVAAWFQRDLGDGLAFLHAQKYWGRHLSPLGPIGGAWRSARAAVDAVGTIVTAPSTLSPDQAYNVRLAAWNLVDFGVLVAAVALTVVVFRRLGVVYGVYSTAVIAIAIAAPVTDGGEVQQSIGRLLLADFPLFIAGASLLQRSPTRRGLTLGVLAAVGAAACLAFSRGSWVA